MEVIEMKIGIISFAHMHAVSYAKCIIQNPEVELIGIFDEQPDRWQDMAQEFNTHLFAHIDDLLMRMP
jgi:UDP-N-acetylglucosamine 3-dehydrogenase